MQTKTEVSKAKQDKLAKLSETKQNKADIAFNNAPWTKPYVIIAMRGESDFVKQDAPFNGPPRQRGHQKLNGSPPQHGHQQFNT